MVGIIIRAIIGGDIIVEAFIRTIIVGDVMVGVFIRTIIVEIFIRAIIVLDIMVEFFIRAIIIEDIIVGDEDTIIGGAIRVGKGMTWCDSRAGLKLGGRGAMRACRRGCSWRRYVKRKESLVEVC